MRLSFALAILLLVSCAPKPPATHVRVLPLDTPVRWVPPPASGGTTVVVPAVGGTF